MTDAKKELMLKCECEAICYESRLFYGHCAKHFIWVKMLVSMILKRNQISFDWEPTFDITSFIRFWSSLAFQIGRERISTSIIIWLIFDTNLRV